MSASGDRIDRKGLWVAAASFVLWGLMPLYWHLLKTVRRCRSSPTASIGARSGMACWPEIRPGWCARLGETADAWMLALRLRWFNWGLIGQVPGHVIETASATSSIRCSTW